MISSFRTNTQKRCPFHYRRLECKSRKSRNTWSNRQIWPESRAKANRVLPRTCTAHSKHPLPATAYVRSNELQTLLGIQVCLILFFAFLLTTILEVTVVTLEVRNHSNKLFSC